MKVEQFEYLRGIVTPDTTEAELNALGDLGWELCGIVGGNRAWFKRSKTRRILAAQGDVQRSGDRP